MKIRRLLSLVLALLVCMSVSAYAEPTIANVWTMENVYITMNERSGMLAVEDRKTHLYTLYSPDGRALTTEPYVRMSNESSMMKVAKGNGLNVYGLIDQTGREVVPCEYGDINYLTDRWQVGVHLQTSDSSNYDYKSFSGDGFYLVTRYDLYYQGNKVGSLSREQYDYAYAYGAFLYVRDKAGDYTYYDSAMKVSPYTTSYASSSEYEETRNGIFHRGSGQRVGVPGCTLSSNDVERDIFIIEGRGVDLQGNILFAVDAKYEYVYDFKGDYARVRMNGKYGLIDRTGREIMACEYDDISYGDEYFEGGYQIAVKNGKVGFVNTKGEVTCEFKYAEKSVESTYRMPATHLNDLDGSVLVLSGAAGELDQRFVEVRISSPNGRQLFVGMPEEDKAGVYDLYGNAVVPADGLCDDAYDFQISVDSKTVLATGTDRVYYVYQINLGNEAAPVVQPAEEHENHQQAPAADGSWTCSCGNVNTTKFCPNCGSGKPEELQCAGCGYKPEAGKTPKFCPNCGTKF